MSIIILSSESTFHMFECLHSNTYSVQRVQRGMTHILLLPFSSLYQLTKSFAQKFPSLCCEVKVANGTERQPMFSTPSTVLSFSYFFFFEFVFTLLTDFWWVSSECEVYPIQAVYSSSIAVREGNKTTVSRVDLCDWYNDSTIATLYHFHLMAKLIRAPQLNRSCQSQSF